MIKAVEQTRRINRFIATSIPKARDLYYKYGERMSTTGVYSTDVGELSDPVNMSQSSTISKVLHMANKVEKDFTSSQKEV